MNCRSNYNNIHFLRALVFEWDLDSLLGLDLLQPALQDLDEARTDPDPQPCQGPNNNSLIILFRNLFFLSCVVNFPDIYCDGCNINLNPDYQRTGGP
jgi:hypothetical protein